MRVKNAIILAAGMGERLRPLTLKIPKPLISVNGMSMIETIISALHKNGIYEIYVVVGHLKEKFQWMPDVFPGLKLIENPYYRESNNISSLYVTREHLGESFIIDGDQFIYDPAILKPELTVSGYNATWCELKTKEWLLEVEDGIIKSCSRNGGAQGYQLYSISRWTEEDGQRLAGHIEWEFEHGNTSIYWDDVALFLYPNEYRLGIQVMEKGAVVEIDSIEELIAVDGSYGVMP